jgi:hypothetical protein
MIARFAVVVWPKLSCCRKSEFLISAAAESIGPLPHGESLPYDRAFFRITAIKAQAAQAAPERHLVEKPPEDIIQDLLGTGDADVLGIATRAPEHSGKMCKIATI